MSDTPGQETPESQEEPRRSLLSPLLWLLVFLFIVYPLSMGPAAVLHKQWPAARPAIEAFYAPIVFLIANYPAVEKFYAWYITRLWRVR